MLVREMLRAGWAMLSVENAHGMTVRWFTNGSAMLQSQQFRLLQLHIWRQSMKRVFFADMTHSKCHNVRQAEHTRRLNDNDNRNRA